MELNLADMFEAVAAAVPERTAIVNGDVRLSYSDLDERTDRLASVLADAGVGMGDFVGIQLPNGNEYLEVMIAAFKLRAVPININYRYTGDELRYLYADAGLVGLVYYADFTPAVNGSLDAMRDRRIVLRVGEDPSSQTSELPGSDYETALADVTTFYDRPVRSADDIYCVYTGGTTGMPKGVLWRQEDIFYAAMGGGDPYQFGNHITTADELVGRIPDAGMVALPVPPFMHAAGHWLAFSVLFGGGKVVTLPGGRFDPATTWRLVGEEGANVVVIVGDAMAVPLIEELEAHPDSYDLSSLMAIGSGGALLSPSVKARIREHLPNLIVRDAFGSSETGQLGGQPPADDPNGPPRLTVDERTTVLGNALRPVEAGSGEVGRLAHGGRVPIGYLGDPDKSAATFVEVDGTRWALPGDLATIDIDGTITILGRESQCINTGGEKVYPEEVEAVLKAHPDVADMIVVGVPDERWGQAVCTLVETRPNSSITNDDLRSFGREKLASYKLPRRTFVVDRVMRSPSGKADTRWARETATDLATASVADGDSVP